MSIATPSSSVTSASKSSLDVLFQPLQLGAIALSFIMAGIFNTPFFSIMASALLPFAGYILVFTVVALGGFIGLRKANII